MSSVNVDLFLQGMQSRFLNAFQGSVPDLERILTIIPSTGASEEYGWVSPPAGMSQWDGGPRKYAHLTSRANVVENLDYSDALLVPYKSIQDDRLGGYLLSAQSMGKKAREARTLLGLGAINGAESLACFDGSNLVDNSHSIGTGDNEQTYDASDGSTNRNLYALYLGGAVNAVGWQNRLDPQLANNYGSFEAEESWQVKFIASMRGATFGGDWSNIVKVKISGEPTVAEMHEIFDLIDVTFKSFVAPKALPDDSTTYIHGTSDFNSSNLLLLCNPSIGATVRKALNQTTLASAESNVYQGFASYFSTSYISD